MKMNNISTRPDLDAEDTYYTWFPEGRLANEIPDLLDNNNIQGRKLYLWLFGKMCNYLRVEFVDARKSIEWLQLSYPELVIESYFDQEFSSKGYLRPSHSAIFILAGKIVLEFKSSCWYILYPKTQLSFALELAKGFFAIQNSKKEASV